MILKVYETCQSNRLHRPHLDADLNKSTVKGHSLNNQKIWDDTNKESIINFDRHTNDTVVTQKEKKSIFDNDNTKEFTDEI